jgi:hypothetical protein
MNYASSRKSAGKPGHILISAETANLLIASGRDKWARIGKNRYNCEVENGRGNE